jgi:hypothetical protein
MIIGATGAGATGKTTVMEKVAEKLELPFMPSVVRGFFAEKNMPEGEKALEGKSLEFKFQFQLDLFYHYCFKLEDMVKANLERGFVSDRTPFDHVAYIIYYSAEIINLGTIHQIIDKAADASKVFDNIFHFPYPVSWSKDKDADSFRIAPPGKNFMWDATLFKINQIALNKNNELELISLNNKRVKKLTLVPDITPEKRIKWILNIAENY